MNDTPTLEFRGVSKAFAAGNTAKTAVSDLNLTVERGRFVCLIGPSGCGKSTLLNMAAGLMEPSTGQVLYDGEPVTRINERTGYITQRDNLLPWRTLRRNLTLPLEIQGVPGRQARQRADEVMAAVGLDGYGDHYLWQLSGGMRKRATFARTYIYEPETLLMDEPFGALDAQRRLQLQTQVLDLWERDKKTVLFVTHDLEEAISLGDTVVVFGTNPGRIIWKEDIHFPRPRNLVDIRVDPEFHTVWKRLYSYLEDPTAARSTK